MYLEKSFSLLRLLVPLSFLLEPADLYADSADAVLVDEATVYENLPDTNGGADSLICIGNTGTTANTRRAFVRYTLPAIPAGSTVDRVVWGIFQDRVRSMGSGPLVATLLARRVTVSWTEGAGSGGSTGPCGGGQDVFGVDWATQPTVSATGGADAALSASNDVSVVIDTDIGTSDDGLIADVQAWVDNGATNLGWRLAVSDADEATADNSRALVPGTLTIHWTPPVGDVFFADGFESP